MAIYTVKTNCLTNSTAENTRKVVKDNNGRFHIVYMRVATKYNIFHSYSDDNGKTWIEEAITSDTTYDQKYPCVAVDSNNNLHVVWQVKYKTYYQIRYSKYTTSWSAPLDLTSENYNQQYPSIAIDSLNNLHVVWGGASDSSPTYYQIRYSKYTGSWSSPINITSGNYHQDYVSIAIDSNNNLHVVWHGYTSSPESITQIRYSKYTTSWSNPIDLTSESYGQGYPTIAIDSLNNLHVVWHGVSSSVSIIYFQIRYSKYTTSWSNPIDLTSENYHQLYPSIAINSNDNLYIAWHGKSSISPSYYQIRYVKYVTSWSDVVDLTDGVSKWYPSLLWAENFYSIPTSFCFAYMDVTTLKFYIYVKKKLSVMGYF